MQGFRDPYNRKTFSKKEINEEIFTHYKALTAFRTEYKEDFKGNFNVVYENGGCLVFQRESLLCAVNMNDNTEYIEGLHGKQIFASHQTRNHPNGILVPANGFAAYQI